jgi:hypothetical protein
MTCQVDYHIGNLIMLWFDFSLFSSRRFHFVRTWVWNPNWYFAERILRCHWCIGFHLTRRLQRENMVLHVLGVKMFRMNHGFMSDKPFSSPTLSVINSTVSRACFITAGSIDTKLCTLCTPRTDYLTDRSDSWLGSWVTCLGISVTATGANHREPKPMPLLLCVQ